MNTTENGEICGGIDVGSGTTGANIAHECRGHEQRLLMLERETYLPLNQASWTFGPKHKENHGPALVVSLKFNPKFKEVQTEVQGGVAG